MLADLRDREEIGLSAEGTLGEGETLLRLEEDLGCSNTDFFSLNSSHLIIPRGSKDLSTNFSNSSDCLNFDSDTAFFPLRYLPSAGSVG